jgi:hypothetical protein
MQNSGGIINRLRNGARAGLTRVVNSRAPSIIRRAARAVRSRLGAS